MAHDQFGEVAQDSRPIRKRPPQRAKRVTQARQNWFHWHRSDSPAGCAYGGCVGAIMGVVFTAIGQILIGNKMLAFGIPVLILGVSMVVFGLAISAVQGAATLTGPCPYCMKEVTGVFPGFNCPHCEGPAVDAGYLDKSDTSVFPDFGNDLEDSIRGVLSPRKPFIQIIGIERRGICHEFVLQSPVRPDAE